MIDESSSTRNSIAIQVPMMNTTFQIRSVRRLLWIRLSTSFVLPKSFICCIPITLLVLLVKSHRDLSRDKIQGESYDEQHQPQGEDTVIVY